MLNIKNGKATVCFDYMECNGYNDKFLFGMCYIYDAKIKKSNLINVFNHDDFIKWFDELKNELSYLTPNDKVNFTFKTSNQNITRKNYNSSNDDFLIYIIDKLINICKDNHNFKFTFKKYDDNYDHLI
jgi:hypothetical protein